MTIRKHHYHHSIHALYHNQYITLPLSYHIIQSRKFTIPLGSPDPRLLLTGFLQLVLAQSEGATRDKSLRIEV